MSDIVERLKDEIERLRAALRKIADGKRDADQSYATLFAELVREARAALPSRDHLAAFDAALSPAPSEGGDGWQDIASAPRDGTPIQIWQEGLEPNQYVAAFDEGWSNGGWWLICDGKNTEIPLRGPAPTHWRHVFAAPSKGGDDGK